MRDTHTHTRGKDANDGMTDDDVILTRTQVVLAAAIVTKGGKGALKFHFFRFVRAGMRVDVAWGGVDVAEGRRRGFSRASKRSILMIQTTRDLPFSRRVYR